ncbi:MAG: ribonucleoside-diphosphate reductase subunit alpha, partial [Acidimicrobiales bacterium]
PLETPQYFFMRVACGLAEVVEEALSLYALMSRLDYLPSSPTLLNSGTTHQQMSSCYLLDSPKDELADIYRTYSDVAALSKHAGGIGVAFHRVRSRGSLIKGTNGFSSGVVPWLRTLDASVAAVNQGGRRKGAACVYLETWHADIEEFLELRDATGDQARRVHHINLANWVPDLFMERVEHDWVWSLFDPKVVPELCDLHGEEFERAYLQAEQKRLFERQVSARQLFSHMMRTLAETGNGWMAFKDAANRTCNQAAQPGTTVHLSNLCTEILELTSSEETAVCNLGSINLAHLVRDGAFDFAGLAEVIRVALPLLDRVVDLNYYPTPQAAASNARWRPVGLGVMGLADVFYQLRIPFDSEPARRLNQQIFEEVYFQALSVSSELAEANGPHPAYAETHAAAGRLQFDLWKAVPAGVAPKDPDRWEPLRERIARFGLRNSLLLAVAPTATIASIAGCSECIEPQVSNVFKRETLSGEFLQVNKYLVRELQAAGRWDEETRTLLKMADGSVQELPGIDSVTRELYRTAWEVPMRSLIDMAAERGPFIDQSQSLNLFVAAPTIAKLSSMYLHAWKKGLKTTYYLRSKPATRIASATYPATPPTTSTPTSTPTYPAASTPTNCNLSDPESCEACQ